MPDGRLTTQQREYVQAQLAKYDSYEIQAIPNK